MTWLSDQRAITIQTMAERRAREETWRRNMERTLRAKRQTQETAAKKISAPKVPPPPATRGMGWSVVAEPIVAHTVLEARAHAIWKFVWHEADWPEGWRIKWGELNDSLLGLGGAADTCAARSGRRVLGLAVMKERIILIDEANAQARPVRDVVQTIIHELCHVNVRSTVHGPQFQAALKSAMAYYDGASVAPVPPKGVRFGPDGWFDPKQLEFRG